MLRRNSFLLIGTTIALATVGAGLGCGGEEFATADPTADLDGSTDTKFSDDRRGSDGVAGAGGNGGAGGSGGRGGSTGGTTGTGGASGRSGADSGRDGGATDGTVVEPDVSDAPRDVGALDDGDVWADNVLDGAPRSDVDSGPVDATSDASADGPTYADAKDAADTGRDGRNDAPEADAGCSPPTIYYKDEDSDGFGKNSETLTSCTPPGGKWSVLNGDCRDDLPNVKPFLAGSPNPPLYSGVGYADVTKPQSVSYDYDCTGTEDADPTNDYGVEPDCSKLLNCTGVGYVPVNPTRTGSGIDPHCGSTSLKRCSGALPCTTTFLTAMAPYRCR
ncbi:MAG TPA: hypothetical protein VK550_05345 [Polyangiaceae bacterium]|nr:hypothetical protein [Polyangiaceae bacterium]